MNEVDVFVLADQELGQVVSRISDEQWNMHLPAWFQAGRTQKDPTLRDIINYHAYDDVWVPDTLAGKTVASVGAKHDGDLLGTDPKSAFAKYVHGAIEAVRGVKDLDELVHLSYGDYPVREYLKHITYFRGVRVHDISKLIGAGGVMSPELVQGLWDELRPEAETWRKLGVFGPEVEVSSDAPLQDRLLALTGRDPKH